MAKRKAFEIPQDVLTVANMAYAHREAGQKWQKIEQIAKEAKEGERYNQAAPTKYKDLSGETTASRVEVAGAHGKSSDGAHRAGATLVGAASGKGKDWAAADAAVVKAGARASHGNWAAACSARGLSAGAAAEAKGLHAEAGAEVTVGKVEAKLESGLKFVDKHLHASASGPTAGAKSEASLETLTLSGSVGAHAGEAKAGPFAARAGVKFGGGIEGGVPVAHLGPVSAPCCIQ